MPDAQKPAAVTLLTAAAAGDTGATVDTSTRTISGVAVPYGPVGYSNRGAVTFSQGSLTLPERVGRIKLLRQHDPDRSLGYATGLDDRQDGLYATFAVPDGPDGDLALAEAQDGRRDGLSVGVLLDAATVDTLWQKLLDGDESPTPASGSLSEVSQVSIPAFDDARIDGSIAAARDASEPVVVTFAQPPPKEGHAMPDALVADAPADVVEASAAAPAAPRAVAGAALTSSVREELPYRFDGLRAGHSFVADLRASASGDMTARQRLETFMADPAVFAVTTGGVGTLNPTQNRPELYVENLTFSRPLYELVTTGSITDKTPFTVPKFGAAAGLVSDHVEGVEPAYGSFSATNQTITPGAVSGKIEINREVWDEGGSPQADQIVWQEMLNGWAEAIEGKIAARLAGVTTPELNLAGAVDAALVDALVNYLAGLQFVRGGNRFSAFAADGQLFPALIGAKDTAGRKLLPVLGATNAQGTASGGFDAVSIGNLTARAAWALGSGNAALSYLFVPSSVFCWTSAPSKFVFEFQIKSVDMGVWGYAATAVTRDSDVKPIDYTTADV